MFSVCEKLLVGRQLLWGNLLWVRFSCRPLWEKHLGDPHYVTINFGVLDKVSRVMDLPIMRASYNKLLDGRQLLRGNLLWMRFSCRPLREKHLGYPHYITIDLGVLYRVPRVIDSPRMFAAYKKLLVGHQLLQGNLLWWGFRINTYERKKSRGPSLCNHRS